MGMTKEQVQQAFGGLEKRHRGEIAQAVRKYCEDNQMSDIAEWLGHPISWVRDNLDRSGIAEAVGGRQGDPPYEANRSDERAILAKFGPTDSEQNSGEFEPYLEHYQSQGHSDAAAKRLAKAEWAGEAAVEAGVIQETRNKHNEKVNKITFPEHDEDTFAMDLKLHTARVEAAARFLDNAKMSNLRKESTCEKVASANVKWLEQVERIRNLHPAFV